jgi:hypothetical protein
MSSPLYRVTSVCSAMAQRVATAAQPIAAALKAIQEFVKAVVAWVSAKAASLQDRSAEVQKLEFTEEDVLGGGLLIKPEALIPKEPTIIAAKAAQAARDATALRVQKVLIQQKPVSRQESALNALLGIAVVRQIGRSCI